MKLATAYFETALRQGSPFEAYYYLADIQARQVRSKLLPSEIAGSSCAVAVSFYKLVAERGTWEDDMLRDADYAWSLGTERGSEMAMLRWWVAAERGFEVAQNNLAYVLDQGWSSHCVRMLSLTLCHAQTRASCASRALHPNHRRTTPRGWR